MYLILYNTRFVYGNLQLNYYEILKPNDIKRNDVTKPYESELLTNSKGYFSRSAHVNDDTGAGAGAGAMTLSFNRFNSDFQLSLRRNYLLLSADIRAYSIDANGNKKPIKVGFNQIYDGIVIGKANSEVSALIEDSRIKSAIIKTDDKIYLIEPIWRLFPNKNSNDSVIYRSDDVKTNKNQRHPNYENKFTQFTQFCRSAQIIDNIKEEDQNNRFKRHHKSSFTPINTRCGLNIVADYSFYKEIGNLNKEYTINYIIQLINYADIIFSETEWKDNDAQNGFKGIGFTITDILIHDEPSVDPSHYNYGKNWEENELLEAFSREKSNKNHCLSYLLTHRQFGNTATLGIAYRALKGKKLFGICSDSVEYKNKILYPNTGFITTLNYMGQTITQLLAMEVFAHELGHSLGAEHDPDSGICTHKDSPYIMSPVPGIGHSKLFSSCSISSIKRILEERSANCFIKPEKSFCGNYVLDDGEECDEGLINLNGKCCNSICKLLPGTDCADQNHECCSNCKILSEGNVCKDNDHLTCKSESFCDGTSVKCPKPQSSPNGVKCFDSGTCFNGTCISYCEMKNQFPCTCKDPKYECSRCCRDSSGVCSVISQSLYLDNGTPCLNGICNNGECVNSDHDDANLGNIFSNIPFVIFLTLLLSVIIIGIIAIIIAVVLRNQRNRRSLRNRRN